MKRLSFEDVEHPNPRTHMNARIITVASAFPEHCVDAAQVKNTLRRVFGARVPQLEHYCQAIDHCGIETRQLVLPVEETTRARPLGEEFMKTPPEPGSRGIGVAFGPGFCMEMLLLRAVDGEQPAQPKSSLA